jgi:hypothetical protein
MDETMIRGTGEEWIIISGRNFVSATISKQKNEKSILDVKVDETREILRQMSYES